MSWYTDKLIKEALDNVVPSGGFVYEARLEMWGKIAPHNGAQNVLAVATPVMPSVSMAQATSCTFETADIFDVFVNYTASASSITLSDFFYVGRYPAHWQNDHSPPYIYCLATNFSGPIGTYIVVSKNNWNIGGTLFPSARCAGRSS